MRRFVPVLLATAMPVIAGCPLSFEPDVPSSQGDARGSDAGESANLDAMVVDSPRTLAVSILGTGRGRIRSQPAAIDCTSACSAEFPRDQLVTLTRESEPGSTFAGWSGDCSGLGACQVRMGDHRNVGASFEIDAHPVTVHLIGDGLGSVTDDRGGIDCGTDCAESYPGGQTLRLTAMPSVGATFAGWSGACSGSGACALTVDGPKDVTASFSVRQARLTLALAGDGRGVIDSNPAGISCGSTCSANFPWGSVITLSASAVAGSSFAEWTGSCAGSGDTCTVKLEGDRSVVATFAIRRFILEVSKAGGGTGRVESAPVGLDCGNACQYEFAEGTVVRLTATPNGASGFERWSGDCVGATCELTMSGNKSVTAHFGGARHTMTVSRVGSATGRVTSTPPGIDCGSDCDESFAQGDQVTLTATPDGNASFAGWSGACSGSRMTCTVVMNHAQTVTAAFDTLTRSLSVQTSGPGVVESDPAGILCPAGCSASFAQGTAVDVLARPAIGAGFVEWTGACVGPLDCQVVIDRSRTVRAEFDNGLVAYYPFSGDASDRSRNGHDGVVLGASLAPDRNGIDDSAYDFDSLDEVVVSQAPELSGMATVTVCAWIMPTSSPASVGYIVTNTRLGDNDATTDAYMIALSSSRRAGFRVWTGSDAKTAESSSSVPLDSWTHLCGVYDGRDARIYQDARLLGQRSLSGRLNITSSPLRIGRCTATNGCSDTYYGRIDDVKIWSRPLSTSDVQAEFLR